MDLAERKGRILSENKRFFHSFYAGINYSLISWKYNLFRLVCYANNLRSLGGGVFLSLAKNLFMLFLNMSALTTMEEKW